MSKIILTVVTAACLAALAACAPTAVRPAATTSTPLLLTATWIPSVTPTLAEKNLATPDPGQPFLKVNRSGGIMGVNENWTFYPDGRVVLPDTTQKKAPAEKAEALRQAFLKADLTTLVEAGKKPVNCADCYVMTIIFLEGDNQTRFAFSPELSDANPQAKQLLEAVWDYLKSAS